MAGPKRLLVDEGCIDDGTARLVGEIYHHACRVMRLGPGDALVLTDGRGRAYSGTIERVDARAAHVRIGPATQLPAEPAPMLTLVYGIARGTKTEWVLQKATELGVGRIVPAICDRSISRPEPKKHLRWQQVVRQAARQSERAYVPVLVEPQPLADALRTALDAPALRLLATPAAEVRSVDALVAELGGALAEVVLVVGPEGGFTEREIGWATAAGYRSVGLGSNVLRSETAALALVTIVAHRCGRM